MSAGSRMSTGERQGMRDRIKVLFVAADPFREGARSGLDEAMRTIGHAVRQGPAGGAVELVAHFGTRAADLHAALLRHRPQVVHFAGPGDQPGIIRLADEDGRPRPVEKEALRGLLGARSPVRVVVLDGYDTQPLVETLSEGVDYAIGMDGPVADRSAVLFAQ